MHRPLAAAGPQRPRGGRRISQPEVWRRTLSYVRVRLLALLAAAGAFACMKTRSQAYATCVQATRIHRSSVQISKNVIQFQLRTILPKIVRTETGVDAIIVETCITIFTVSVL